MKKQRTVLLVLVSALLLAFAGCAAPPLTVPASTMDQPSIPEPGGLDDILAPKDATEITRKANQELGERLPFADQQDFEDAQRGFIATLPEVVITSDDGRVVWSLKGYEFLQQQDPPPTVNPSLWRMAKLNMTNGLFMVTDRIYQVRGFDLSNMTIVEGDTGVIVIDPLSSTETARAALDLYYQERGQKPVVAVLYTHSHHDHYAGVKGVTSDEDVAAGRAAVLAPDGWLDAVVSENVFAGNAMARRASYQYGMFLPLGARGQVDSGLGKGNPHGTGSLIAPTDIISRTGEVRVIDGVEMVFQIVSGTEAPSEMTIYFPQFKALNAAEIACPLLHNVLTLRGAEVRDAKLWAQSLDELIALYGDKTEVVLAQHNWPTWGQENVLLFLADQRDLYAYLHDQTLRLINQGYTGSEIAEMLKLPAGLDQQWYTRDYYGTLSHNAKAIYQKYIGWYDGNPANLHALPPEDAGRKFVEYMGGADEVIARAREDFEKGDYRWVAQVMSQVVFADPSNLEARALEADALEQLGYQTEAGTWRNWYLAGAYELRNGVPEAPAAGGNRGADTVKAMTIPLIFDYWGIRLNAALAEGKQIVINWSFTDTGETYALTLRNSALTYRGDWQDPDADLTLTLARPTLDAITLGQAQFGQEVAAGNIWLEGDGKKLGELLSMLETFNPVFPMVTP